jgi:hypothetical protein
MSAWFFDDGTEWPIYIWLPIVAALGWAAWTFRAEAEPSANGARRKRGGSGSSERAGKAFDFNPRRGLFYFLAGLIAFPLLAVIDAIFGAELTLSSMILYTLVASTMAGLAGLFTENIGL